MQDFKGDLNVDKEKFELCKSEGIPMCIYVHIPGPDGSGLSDGRHAAEKLAKEWEKKGILEGFDFTGGQAAFFCTEDFTYQDFLDFGVELKKRLALLDKDTYIFRRLCLIPDPGVGLMVFPEGCPGPYEDEHPKKYFRPSQYTNFAKI